jgi:hypothetical protein
MFAIRLPEEHRPWAAQDVVTLRFLTWRIVRSIVVCLLLLGLAVVGFHSTNRWPSRTHVLIGVLVCVVFGLLSSRKTLIRKTLRWQHVDKHGNPSHPAGAFVRLGNAEAALLAVVGLVLWAAASAVLGYGTRPTTLPAAKCDPVDAATTGRIEGAFKAKGTTISLSRLVTYEGGAVVATIVKPPDKEAKFAAFVSEDGTLYELELRNRDRVAEPVVTSLPKRALDVGRPQDRLVSQAVIRSATCLGEAGTH